MNFFSREGLKILAITFAVSFLLGGIVFVVGFCMIIDLLAK